MSDWLGLTIGNSRLHWALFTDSQLIKAWDTAHLANQIDSAKSLFKAIDPWCQNIVDDSFPVYIASVVPSQTALWRNYSDYVSIDLFDIPLKNTYPTFGIDRALAVYGAGEVYGYPCLVIDAGTALTFTGVDGQKALVGGAIVLGLRAQFKGLHRQTAALPEVSLPHEIPTRWALDTPDAIASGIVYTTMSGIHDYIDDWLSRFPQSSILLTGGDRETIEKYLDILYLKTSQKIQSDGNLIFWGMRSLKQKNSNVS